MKLDKLNIINNFEIVLIGASAGGFNAFEEILPKIKKNFPLPIVIVQHSSPGSNDYLIEYFNQKCPLTIKEANQNEYLESSNVYFAPSDYHLLIEEEKCFSLSIDEKVNYSRPSIDLLFESAAYVYKNKIICIVLSGANSDGTNGAKLIKDFGGYIIAQDPLTAESKMMPQSVIENNISNAIMNFEEIIIF